MTRINCVPPRELVRQHLLAEYRELPRVFKAAERAYQNDIDFLEPPEYVLGKGHVSFFYRRLGYCKRRFLELVREMKRRGYQVNFPDTPRVHVPSSWHGDWQPTGKARALNRQRIQDRLST